MCFFKLGMEVSFPNLSLFFLIISFSVIPPDQPVINAELEPGNIVRVPAGSDYTVLCTSQGFPTPFVRWVDHEGNV